jgi:UPF0716 family protein affecting phage T7 exclusion
MKKFIKVIALGLVALSVTGMTSCATILGEKITQYQKTRPAPDKPRREVRVGALITDILLFWPGTIVDFATNAIYKPQQKSRK